MAGRRAWLKAFVADLWLKGSALKGPELKGSGLKGRALETRAYGCLGFSAALPPGRLWHRRYSMASECR
jgi:hypothetical protein